MDNRSTRQSARLLLSFFFSRARFLETASQLIVSSDSRVSEPIRIRSPAYRGFFRNARSHSGGGRGCTQGVRASDPQDRAAYPLRSSSGFGLALSPLEISVRTRCSPILWCNLSSLFRPGGQIEKGGFQKTDPPPKLAFNELSSRLKNDASVNRWMSDD